MMPKQVALWIWVFPALLLAHLCIPATALSEGLRILSDVENLTAHTKVTNKQTGETTKNDLTRLSRIYDLGLRKEIYPNLNLRTGWLFNQKNEWTTQDGENAKRRGRTIQYFAGLNLDNPLHKIAATYRRGKDKARSIDTMGGFNDERLVRNQAIFRWNWRPAGLPSFNLDYNRSDVSDRPKTIDSLNELLSLRTRYDYKDLSLDYTFTRNDTEERESDSGSLTQINNGSIRYSTRFLDNRLSLTAGARLNHSTLEPAGTGDIRRGVSSVESQFYLLDDPGMGTTNDSGDFTVVDADNPLAAVNIGFGGPLDPVSVGMEFSSPTEVSIVYVIPDVDTNGDRPDLATPSEINALTFVWEVFISDDQENWTLQAGVTSDYYLINNRYEILFPEVTTRYIKVRTIPQSDTAPGRIPILRLQALTSIPGTAGKTLKDLNQNYNLGARWAITDRTSTTYDVNLRVQESKPSTQKRTTLTNSASLRHLFNPIFSANARVLRSDSDATDRKKTVGHTYVASLRGDYLETFNQTLLYSGTHTTEQTGGSTTTNSIFLRNTADLYRDWSANLDLGQTWRNSDERGKTESSILRVRTNMIPNRKLHLTLDYTLARIVESGEPTRFQQSGHGQLFFVPWSTLSIFVGGSFKDRGQRGDGGMAVSQDYSVTWAPFPDGSFNVSASYRQTKDNEGRDEEFFTPELRWEIARGILMTFRYSNGTIESDTQKSDVEIFNGKLRIFY